MVLPCACTHLCRRVGLKWRVYMPLGASFFEDVPLVEFIYLVFTRTPGGVIVVDSNLCCCVPCLSSAISSLCMLIILQTHTTCICTYIHHTTHTMNASHPHTRVYAYTYTKSQTRWIQHTCTHYECTWHTYTHTHTHTHAPHSHWHAYTNPHIWDNNSAILTM